ncbi:MAG: bifunctional phosphopantothenoylcysteine decarboxylase/phosphopantothenate--cysteine ligase CoaBC [Bacteroidetes bacterium]|nr:bifunctional phosphopantothenoylcysteine decarboxylase/phosphopantothenate--cysteine ligase CoaBC [Bacteroidota bacterium]
MSVFQDKKILLGVCGGIAAYKTASLVRLLVKAGATVKVIMTPSAKDFVTPLTLATLSKNPVLSGFTEQDDPSGVWNNHVDLGLWADAMVIAPATANTLSKMTDGACDNLLLAVYLSAKCPVYFAPAMDLDMYQHPATQSAFDKLQSYGNIMIPATSGELASGLVGQGRMAEPEDIVAFIEKDLTAQLPLRNKTVLITAGPTYEAIDPVRFIGNHSTGKMGFEIAKAAANLGAEVILISGPSQQTVSHPKIILIRVTGADQMYDAVHQHYSKADIAILSAAVSDYKPKTVISQKIKKKDQNLQIELVPTPDILASLGKIKKQQFLVGFALETNDEIENAKGKLTRKNLDLIVLNSLNDAGAGFGTPTNKITLIDKSLEITSFDLKSKTAVAYDILNHVILKLQT